MLWIKRNLFLAIGGLVAVLLLGFGLYFSWGAMSRNTTLESEIEQTTNSLNNMFNAPVFPGPTNIDRAKLEAEKLKGAATEVLKLFTPVQAEKVTGIAFRSYRDKTLAELHEMARTAQTTLPGRGYAFSFETQKTKVDFKEGTFPAIPQQMAEVKAICKVIFDGHVDPLINIRRARVSQDDEESNASSDYLFLPVETNLVTDTITSPYEFSFNCLSSDLAAVLQGLQGSPHGFIVKAVHTEPAVEPAAAAPGAPAPGRPGAPPGQPLPKPGVPPVAAPKGAGSDRPVVFLKERRLKITLLIYAVRPAK